MRRLTAPHLAKGTMRLRHLFTPSVQPPFFLSAFLLLLIAPWYPVEAQTSTALADAKLRRLLQSTGGSEVVPLEDLISEPSFCEPGGYVWNPEQKTDEVGKGYSRYGASSEYDGGRSSGRGSRGGGRRSASAIGSGIQRASGVQGRG